MRAASSPSNVPSSASESSVERIRRGTQHPARVRSDSADFDTSVLGSVFGPRGRPDLTPMYSAPSPTKCWPNLWTAQDRGRGRPSLG